MFVHDVISFRDCAYMLRKGYGLDRMRSGSDELVLQSFSARGRKLAVFACLPSNTFE